MELIDSAILFVQDHYQWLFSGLGVVVLGMIFRKRLSSINKVTQKNINAGGDVVGRDKK